MPENTLMSFDNPVLKSYCFYVAILGLKMLLMSLLTGRQRFKKLNGLDDDPLGNDDIRLESPDSDKHRDNDLDQLIDTMDIESSETCGLNNINLNHIDSNSSPDGIPASLEKRINGEMSGPE